MSIYADCRDAIYRVLFGYGVFRRRDKSRLYRGQCRMPDIDPSGFMLGFAPLTPTYPGYDALQDTSRDKRVMWVEDFR
uniref:Uncharacterized protein n=1 Tax=Candidatus Kentrum sp. DK TaxID=2126562 RepID=A0A450S6L4_9GAMM|nr:MAG: hypothetical protein BECKDK2373C_GA0170839_101836 [Candidatus Kentron sp. DK]